MWLFLCGKDVVIIPNAFWVSLSEELIQQCTILFPSSVSHKIIDSLNAGTYKKIVL